VELDDLALIPAVHDDEVLGCERPDDAAFLVANDGADGNKIDTSLECGDRPILGEKGQGGQPQDYEIGD